MTGYFVFLLVILFFLFLLFCNFKFIIYFENELDVCIKYLFLKFHIGSDSKKEKSVNNKNEEKKEANKETIDAKEKDVKKSKKEKKESSSKNKIKKIISEKGFSGFLKIVKNLMTIAKNLSSYLLKHIYVVKFYLELKVSEEDSAQTAIKYGQACAVLYPAVNFLFQNIKMNKPTIKIYPDFNSEKTCVNFSAVFKIRLIYILKASFVAFFKFIKNFISLKNLKTRKV